MSDKVDLFKFKRPERMTKTVPFVDGKTITLRKMNSADEDQRIDLMTDAIETYVTGSGKLDRITGRPDPKDPSYRPPLPFHPVDGEPVRVSRTTCYTAAALAVMNQDGYTIEDFIVLQIVAPDDYDRIVAVANKLDDEQEQKDENPTENDDDSITKT